MVRTLLYVAGGVLLGLVIHLIVILTLPRVAPNQAYLQIAATESLNACLLYTSPSPRDRQKSRMPSSA